ncbi:type IV secretory system conjugative DNA transfer family protein [Streptomyces sp. NPDC007084]|uniref:type IV secretory system conjugative DNA transfer family protein n=1 Tax=Streptomyces sp. NPDC007084 TaxID=3154313 RepID=UPI00345728E8
MRPDDRHGPRREGEGGIPDGLLIGVLGFLLGMTLMVWTATGLAGLFSRGGWPDAVTFPRTPLAMRHLIGSPHDMPGAWPDTPAAQLSGYGLFWGLFIGQLMVLLVLTVFVMGTVARWRAGRARRRAEARAAAKTGAIGPVVPSARTEQGTWTEQRPPADSHAPGPAQPPSAQQPPPGETPHTPHTPYTPYTASTAAAFSAAEAPPGAGTSPGAGPGPGAGPATGPGAAPGTGTGAGAAATAATMWAGGREAAPTDGAAPLTTTPAQPKQAWENTHAVVLATAEARRPTASQAVRDAEGPALVVTSDPRVWSETKDARAKLGPVLLYDPTHLCDTPARLHWSPAAGCQDKETAAARASALLAAVRPTAKVDQAMADVAETLLRSYLHAAAVEGKAFRHVHRWAQGTQVQDAVRALRTNPKSAPGAAGELEAALTSHPERRDIAQELTARALSSFGTVNIRESCTPNRTDSLTLDSFVDEGGTLYVIGEPIEDPKANPGAMPLLTALASSVVERGRRMAERSSSGRLDPPLTLVLDDVAAVAPLPQLPDLLTTGPTRGLPTLALLRSREQLRARWPSYELPD